ncbi:MAG: hypothetical protein IKU53_03495 [Firmicutes bacterium]|nr:hypothetical protein [Bacillota bacterium]
MKRFNFFCSLVVVLTMTVSIIAIAQNITLRTSAPYTFYFNDTYVVSRVSSEYVNSEMSGMIADFFNSWNPEEFQIYEDTGYDIEGLFDEKDNHNMLAIKRALDISLVMAITSLIITVAIYLYFLKNDFKPVLRNRFKATAALTAVLLAFEMFLLNTDKGIAMAMKMLGLKVLEEDSRLAVLLGEGFISLADNFLLGFTVCIFIAAAYVTHMLTKPPRIFF